MSDINFSLIPHTFLQKRVLTDGRTVGRTIKWSYNGSVSRYGIGFRNNKTKNEIDKINKKLKKLNLKFYHIYFFIIIIIISTLWRPMLSICLPQASPRRSVLRCLHLALTRSSVHLMESLLTERRPVRRYLIVELLKKICENVISHYLLTVSSKIR